MISNFGDEHNNLKVQGNPTARIPFAIKKKYLALYNYFGILQENYGCEKVLSVLSAVYLRVIPIMKNVFTHSKHANTILLS